MTNSKWLTRRNRQRRRTPFSAVLFVEQHTIRLSRAASSQTKHTNKSVSQYSTEHIRLCRMLQFRIDRFILRL
mgnify:FL=1